MAEVRLKISDIDCAACVRRVHRALAACSGVESAQVSYASVWRRCAMTRIEQILRAL